MKNDARELRAREPFEFVDYDGLVMPTGLHAANLREFLEIVRTVHADVLHHHLNRAFLWRRLDSSEYPNDFANWAALRLEDLALAEKLSTLDPFVERDLERARDAIVEIVEEHLDGLPTVPWVRPGSDFHFSRGRYLALPSGRLAWTLTELREELQSLSLSSLYFHFHEARLRGPGDDADDFSRWIGGQLEAAPVVNRMLAIDWYFLSLSELRGRLVAAIDGGLQEIAA
jgi:hypothetical protein